MGNVWWFCKVEFLCYANEPNWLGWIVLIIMAVSALLALFFAWVFLGSLRDERRSTYLKTSGEWTEDEKKYNNEKKYIGWYIWLCIIIGVIILSFEST